MSSQLEPPLVPYGTLPSLNTALSAPGPIAAAAAAAHQSGKPKQTSLLSSALGHKPSAAIAAPSHPLSHSISSYAEGGSGASGTSPVVELERVLNSWERAWMGTEVAEGDESDEERGAGRSRSGRRGVSSSPCTTGSTPNSLNAPSPIAAGPLPVPTSLAPAMAVAVNGSGGSWRSGGGLTSAPPLPATPPPAHSPLAVPIAKSRLGGGAGGALPLSATPPPSHPLLGTGGSKDSLSAAQQPQQRAATPINVHVPVIPKNAKDSTDFASVFFSPLPFSLLNLAHSDSTDHLLCDSIGSPDITLRGGRLAASASITHEDWPVDVHLTAGLQSNGSLSNGGAAPGPAGSRLTDDVTAHGLKRMSSGSSGGTPSPRGGSLGSPTQAVGLVQQQLLQERAANAAAPAAAAGDAANAAVEEGQKARATTVSPDSVLVESLEQQSAQQQQQPASCAVNNAGACLSFPPPAPRTTPALQGPAPTLLLRPALSRTPSPSPPPFSAHPAVASLVMAGGGPVMPGMDLLRASGVSSIASAVEAARRAEPAMMRLVCAAAMIPHIEKVCALGMSWERRGELRAAAGGCKGACFRGLWSQVVTCVHAGSCVLRPPSSPPSYYKLVHAHCSTPPAAMHNAPPSPHKHLCTHALLTLLCPTAG